ncbi:MAG: transposase, partial [Methanothrix sp.]|nr:transposase [Methanothrix sp.]
KRDEKIGHIKSKFRIARYINTKGDKNGFGFSIKRSNAFIDAQNYDGYQIFATTEFDLTERDVVESYRTRDQIEKAIQTLKCALGLHPQYVRTNEHVLGNIFVCSMAYQLRSILKMKLKNNEICMSVDDAMAVLERLKEVEIVIGNGDEIEVRRKLGGVNSESRTLIDVFNMATNGILPGVE